MEELGRREEEAGLGNSMGTGQGGVMPINHNDFWANGVDLVRRENMGFPECPFSQFLSTHDDIHTLPKEERGLTVIEHLLNIKHNPRHVVCISYLLFIFIF